MIVVEVSGDVDLLTAPALSEELRRAQRTRSDVIIDLEKVEFMDCAGLRVLLSAATEAGPGHPRISVTPGPPQIQKLLRLCGTDGALPVVSRPSQISSADRRSSQRRIAAAAAARAAATVAHLPAAS